jgi:hypothetical protein
MNWEEDDPARLGRIWEHGHSIWDDDDPVRFREFMFARVSERMAGRARLLMGLGIELVDEQQRRFPLGGWFDIEE